MFVGMTLKKKLECYKKYKIDNELRLNIKTEDVQHKCKICDEWTQLMASVDSCYWNLCEKHNNRKNVENLFEVFRSWGS